MTGALAKVSWCEGASKVTMQTLSCVSIASGLPRRMGISESHRDVGTIGRYRKVSLKMVWEVHLVMECKEVVCQVLKRSANSKSTNYNPPISTNHN